MAAFLLAQTEWAAPLAPYGLAGVVLAWFMFRTEGRLEKIEKSGDRVAKAILLLVVRDSQVNGATKEQATNLLDEIEDKRKDRS